MSILAGGFNLWLNLHHAHAQREQLVAAFDPASWVASRDINTTVSSGPGGIALVHVLDAPISSHVMDADSASAGESEEGPPGAVEAVRCASVHSKIGDGACST